VHAECKRRKRREQGNCQNFSEKQSEWDCDDPEVLPQASNQDDGKPEAQTTRHWMSQIVLACVQLRDEKRTRADRHKVEGKER
jgi:hypothetical protein